MSQPVLIAMLAIAIAIVLTVAIAIVTIADEHTIRAIKSTLIVVVIGASVIALEHAQLRISFTGSLPIGIYRLVPLPLDGVKRGMMVAVCAPSHAAATGWRRGYLARGPCTDGTELLLKTVAAIAGGRVDVTAAGVAVNGCLLPHSRPVPRDRSGRELAPWPPGRYRIALDQVWLYAPDDQSWDSR